MHLGLYGKRGSNDWTVCCSIVVPCVLLATFKFGIFFFRGSLSCQSSTLKGTHLLQSDFSFSACMALSAANLSVCGEGHSSAAIWCLYPHSFSCEAFTLMGSHLFHCQSGQSVCSYLSPLLSQPFLLLLVCLCQRHSFPPLIGSLGWLWSRISVTFCV